nr:MAG TPA_asm: hypothetical protein [Caudoviricetes sp.]
MVAGPCVRAEAAPALVREATPRHPCNQTK